MDEGERGKGSRSRRDSLGMTGVTQDNPETPTEVFSGHPRPRFPSVEMDPSILRRKLEIRTNVKGEEMTKTFRTHQRSFFILLSDILAQWMK